MPTETKPRKVIFDLTFRQTAILGWEDAAAMAASPAHQGRLLRLAQQLREMPVDDTTNYQGRTINMSERRPVRIYEQRICLECGKLKDLREFGRDHHDPQGHKTVCRTCFPQHRNNHPPNSMRRCKGCGEQKLLTTEFYMNGINRYHYNCKTCYHKAHGMPKAKHDEAALRVSA